MAKKILNLDIDTGAKSWGSVDADNVVLDTTNFDKNLDTTITDVQKLADAVDELELGGTQIQSDWNQTNNTQLDYIKNKPTIPAGLPIGTVNQLLRHNGTDWVATVNSTLTDGNTDATFTIVNNSSPSLQYSMIRQDLIYMRNSNQSVSMFTGSQVGSLMQTAGNEHIYIWGDNDTKRIDLQPLNGSFSQTLRLQATKVYNANNAIINYGRKFLVYQNGKITTTYLSGTDSAILEATADGTIQRSAQIIPDAQVNSDWNATSGVAEILNKPNIPTNIPNRLEFLSDPLTVASDGYAFSNTQLGLDGVNLNDKIKMVQCYVIQVDYPNIKNNELVMGHNIEDEQLSVRTNFNLAVGDRIKIYIEYID